MARCYFCKTHVTEATSGRVFKVLATDVDEWKKVVICSCCFGDVEHRKEETVSDEKTDEITVTLPRKNWNQIRGALIAMKDRRSYLWEGEAGEIVLELEVALQKTPNWEPKKEGRK